ncbi:hypothetical protein [Pontiella agarivorans]|uniref:Uncharacterized protein n=1 Tax=Pontiella agarivorans TaxID=3038953 RepID=A0ABU5MYZ8_9BACT|nr:hypothetical protein [Pontiella agarivorans]MDZ8119427.1 hypothetical protein [Pontiella agarivorans]
MTNRSLTVFLLSFLFTAPLRAGISNGTSSAEVDITGNAAQAPYEVSFSADDIGTDSAWIEDTLQLEDLSGSDGVQADVTFILSNQTVLVTDTGVDYRVTGSGLTRYHMDARDGLDQPLPNTAVFILSNDPGNESIRAFTVTGPNTPCRLTGTILGEDLFTEITLIHHIGDDHWETVRTAAPETVDGGTGAFDLYAILAPGEYRIRARIHGTIANNDTVYESSYTYDLQVGELAAGEFTDDRIGTDAVDSPKLIPVNAAIQSENDLGNGTTEVVITVSLQNDSLCPWAGVEVNIPAAFTGGPDIVPDPLPLQFETLPAQATTAPETGENLTVIVPTADLTAFRTSILNHSRFTTSGKELWVFLYPVFIADAKLSSTGSIPETLTYSTPPPFSAGTLIIEEESIYAVPPKIVNQTPVLEMFQGVDRLLPFLVSEIGEMGYQTYGLSGQQVPLTDVVKHGTIRNTAMVSMPSGLETTHEAGGPVVPNHRPIHFNRIRISDAIELSGSFFLTPGPFSVALDIENRTLQRFEVTATVNAEANLLVETKGAADNTGDTLFQQQKELLSFDLFSIVLPAGFQLTPEISIATGASVQAPSGLSVPLSSSLQVTFNAGVENGVPFYDSEVTDFPTEVSTPAIYRQLEAAVEAWLSAQIKCGIAFGGSTAEIGPTFGIQISGSCTSAPASSPWWSLDGDLDLRAGLELDLFNLITIADVERTIFTQPLFHLEADGAALAAAAAVTLPDNPGMRPLAGEQTRWARVLQTETAPADSAIGAFVLPLTGSDDFIAGCGETFDGDLSRFGPDGELKWSLDTYPAPVISAVAEPDGSFTALSAGFSRIHLGRFDSSGNRLWAVTDKIDSITGNDTRRIVRGESGTGEPEYYVLSRTHQDFRKPSVIKYDGNGDLLWAKLYTPDPPGGEGSSCELSDCLVTSDSNLVFIGTTDADIRSGEGPLNTVNSTDNGLVVKIDGQTGAVIWSILLAHERIPQYNAIAEGPDGSLYLGGSHAVTVLDDLPSMLVTKLDADGTLIDSILIGHDKSLDGDSRYDLIDPLPGDGTTPYDIIRDMRWADGALWIGGQMGIYNSSTSFATGTSAFTARLTAKLGVTRFAIHAGPHYDQIGALGDGGDGLIAVGTTRSFLPWPYGAEDQTDNTPDARLVMKIPWEGLMRFHESTPGAQPDPDGSVPDAGTYFVFPATYPGSILSTFSHAVPAPDPEDPDELVYFDTLPLIVTNLTLTAETPLAAPVFVTPIAHHALESVPAETIDSYADYLDWYQLDPDGDLDGDGLCGASEFFFGTDPFSADAADAALTIEPDAQGITALTFQRALLAAAEGWEAQLEASPDLETWFSLTNAVYAAEPLTSDLEKLIYSPFYVPGEDRRFYRLVKPAAP